jgi:lipoprotein-anchoring transpeptidase ErfK/SrfK
MPQLEEAREIVGFSEAYSSGTVVVKTSERSLYYVLGNGKAVRYPVGVGRRGKQWTGTAFITSKQLRPTTARRPAEDTSGHSSRLANQDRRILALDPRPDSVCVRD